MRMSSCERSAPTAPFMPSPTAVLLGLVLIASAAGCGPGKFGSRRRIPRKLTPLVFKQHVPNVPETSLAASGPFEGKITREDARFKELVPNYSNDIDFRDEEGDGQDRIMTPRCSEKLNTLAISVMNLYPGVRLRVSEGWDDEGYHSKDSLHFEGRAVDLTTSDRDRSKYGMLGRLAVEAGFDFVYYESRSHIHASCKSESAESGRFGGCFHGSSLVETPSGPKAMSQLSIGEEVLVARPDGSFGFSQVILFLDRDEEQRRTYVHIETAGGASLTLTPEHVLFVQEDEGVDEADAAVAAATFARSVEAGDRLYRKGADGRLLLDTVCNVTLTFGVGVYAPLTYEGNIVVNDVVASVYAVLSDQTLAHWAFFPVRVGDNFRQAAHHFWRELRLAPTRTPNNRTVTQPQKGVHWYPSFLYSAYSYALQFL